MAFFNLVQCFSTVSGMWPIFETHRANVFGLWPIFETHGANVCGTWPDYIFSKHAGHVARLHIFETRRARGPIIYFRNTQGTWPDYIFSKHAGHVARLYIFYNFTGNVKKVINENFRDVVLTK